MLMERREDKLRQMADAGHRCAFVRLMELLVDASRPADEIFHELQSSISLLFTPHPRIRRTAPIGAPRRPAAKKA